MEAGEYDLPASGSHGECRKCGRADEYPDDCLDRNNLYGLLSLFIAVIFFTSKLAENSEIIAMFSTGMSFKRMLRPYMVSAAIIAVVTFCLGSYVIPKGSVTRINFEDKYYKPRKANTARNIQLEVDSGVIAYIERFEDYSKTGYRFSLDKFNDKQLVSHLTARSITAILIF